MSWKSGWRTLVWCIAGALIIAGIIAGWHHDRLGLLFSGHPGLPYQEDLLSTNTDQTAGNASQSIKDDQTLPQFEKTPENENKTNLSSEHQTNTPASSSSVNKTDAESAIPFKKRLKDQPQYTQSFNASREDFAKRAERLQVSFGVAPETFQKEVNGLFVKTEVPFQYRNLKTFDRKGTMWFAMDVNAALTVVGTLEPKRKAIKRITFLGNLYASKESRKDAVLAIAYGLSVLSEEEDLIDVIKLINIEVNEVFENRKRISLYRVQNCIVAASLNKSTLLITAMPHDGSRAAQI